jgi:hypothetical protein
MTRLEVVPTLVVGSFILLATKGEPPVAVSSMVGHVHRLLRRSRMPTPADAVNSARGYGTCRISELLLPIRRLILNTCTTVEQQIVEGEEARGTLKT